MTEYVLYLFDGHSVLFQVGGNGMSQYMEAHFLLDVGSFCNAFEDADGNGSEHSVSVVVQQEGFHIIWSVSGDVVLSFVGPVIFEVFSDRAVHGYLSSFSELSFSDGQYHTVEVDVASVEVLTFCAPQSTSVVDSEDGFFSICVCLMVELFDLIDGECLTRVLVRSRELQP